jgi:hypothetical protein
VTEHDKGPPDVEIGASAKARSVRFGRVPETEATFDPGQDGDSESEARRHNLPDEVEPGVTYRDVQVSWRGAAWLAATSEREDAPER